MKLIILLTGFLLTFNLSGQNFVLPDGEYMDTASGKNPVCRNYTVYFYQVGGIYPESSTSLVEEVQAYLGKKNETYSGSGYITFRFTIDCEGKPMKKVQVMQTDANYVMDHT